MSREWIACGLPPRSPVDRRLGAHAAEYLGYGDEVLIHITETFRADEIALRVMNRRLDDSRTLVGWRSFTRPGATEPTPYVVVRFGAITARMDPDVDLARYEFAVLFLEGPKHTTIYGTSLQVLSDFIDTMYSGSAPN
jgi:hypothetical protein